MDDEPLYGKRVSPEELAQILREQGIQPPQPVRRHDVDGRAAGRGASSRHRGGQTAAAAQERRAHGRPRSRWGLFALGLLTMLVLPMLVSVLSVQYVTGGSSSAAAVVPQSGEVYLQQGTQAGIYSTQFGYRTVDCQVTGPDGAAVLTTATGPSANATFAVPRSGLYQVSCPGASPSAVVLVGPALMESRLWAGVVGVLLSGLIGLLGLGLTVAGIVRGVRGGRNRRPAA